MKEHDIKVTLAGDLGDELMCGYPRHGVLSKKLANKKLVNKSILLKFPFLLIWVKKSDLIRF